MHACLRHRKDEQLTSNQLDCATWVLNQCCVVKWSLCYTIDPLHLHDILETLQLESHPRRRYHISKPWNAIKNPWKKNENRMRQDGDIVSWWAFQSPVKKKGFPLPLPPNTTFAVPFGAVRLPRSWQHHARLFLLCRAAKDRKNHVAWRATSPEMVTCEGWTCLQCRRTKVHYSRRANFQVRTKYTEHGFWGWISWRARTWEMIDGYNLIRSQSRR